MVGRTDMLHLADRLSNVPEVLDREANVCRPGGGGEGCHQVAMREELGGGGFLYTRHRGATCFSTCPLEIKSTAPRSEAMLRKWCVCVCQAASSLYKPGSR